MSEKYASDFPLPGGVEQYFDTLVALLRSVGTNDASQDTLEKVLVELCPNASKSTAIGMYLANISRMGLWSTKGGLFRLTTDGHSLLEVADVNPLAARRRVLDIKLRNVAGYPELFQRMAEGPATFAELDAHLKQRLNVTWTSRNQCGFRVGWLRSLGYITKEDQGFSLTGAGQEVFKELNQGDISISGPKPPVPNERSIDSKPASGLIAEAMRVIEQVDQLSTAGGNGSDFERATAAVFRLLGFDVECIGGSGNPDVVASAVMGLQSYRVLIEAKSRTNGQVTQNDVNFLAVKDHRLKASADYVVVFAKGFSGGNLVKWAEDQTVRLLTVEELQQIVLAHAESVIALDRLRDLFVGHGKTKDDVLASLLTEAETSSQRVTMCRDVYQAIYAHQSQEAALNEHSLFYILKGAYSIQAIKETIETLRSGLIAAVERTADGSLYCRLSPRTLMERLEQIRLMMADGD